MSVTSVAYILLKTFIERPTLSSTESLRWSHWVQHPGCPTAGGRGPASGEVLAWNGRYGPPPLSTMTLMYFIA